MGLIDLLKIKKETTKIEYEFYVSSELKKYFTGEKFIIEYPEPIDMVPDAVLAIPFVCGMLPIAWLTDSELHVQELDRDFYSSIPGLKNGFIDMYPDAVFAGTLMVDKITDCAEQIQEQEKSATFFSGGLDSTHTLIRHIDEKPDLLSIWGSDVDYYNNDAWTTISNQLKNMAKKYRLSYVEIKSTFRRFDDVMVLTDDFRSVIHTTWWYGIKHGIGIISHAAPYVWLHKISKVYIASSNCIEDGKQQCASDPTIDSKVSFCGCKVFHDGFESNRQNKTMEIVQYKQNTKLPIHLHVCWKSETGENCCNCEKCYRTMVGLWIAGADPKEYGFDYCSDIFKRIYQMIALRYDDIPRRTWTYMKEALIKNWNEFEGKKYRDELKWMLDYDFLNLDNNECRIRYQKTWKIKSKIVKTFPHIYKLYVKIRNYSFE